MNTPNTNANPDACAGFAAPTGSAHLGVCSSCFRKTWDRNHIDLPFWKCGAKLDDGSTCNGVWIPAATAPPDIYACLDCGEETPECGMVCEECKEAALYD